MNPILLLLLEVTIVFAMALLGLRLASGARAAVRHLILACAFGVVLILPLASMVSPDISVTVPSFPVLTAGPIADTTVAAAPARTLSPGPDDNPTTAVAETSATAARPIPLATWLTLAWAVVAVIALLPMVESLLRLRSIVRSATAWPQGRARMDELARAAGMRPPRMLLHDGIAGPTTGGIQHPVIILPANAAAWSEVHITNALLHELEHVRRRDWLVHLAARSACAIYWFHPLAWTAWRALRLEAERVCDDAVVAREDAATYAAQLLELARHLGQQRVEGLPMAGGSDLSRRVRSVLDNMRPRGRAGKVMVACAVLGAVVAVAMLAPLRLSEEIGVRMDRASAALAQQTEADSLAAAGLLRSAGAGLSHRENKEESLKLLAQASFMAPERADLVWLHIQVCQEVASCDPEPLEQRLRTLDGRNGAGWLAALVRASKSGDEQVLLAALESIAQSERVDTYWTALISRLSPPVARTREVSLIEAEVTVIGALVAQPIRGFRVISDFCKTERLDRDDVVKLCRGMTSALMAGDTVMTEQIGASIARRVWPEGSSWWVEGVDAKRRWDSQTRYGAIVSEWVEDNPREHLALLAQHRREQDAFEAVLVATGNGLAAR